MSHTELVIFWIGIAIAVGVHYYKKGIKEQKKEVIIERAAKGMQASGAVSLKAAFAYHIREEVARKLNITPSPELNTVNAETRELIACHVLLLSQKLKPFQIWPFDVANMALGALAMDDNKQLYRFLCMNDFALRATPRELTAVTGLKESFFTTLKKHMDTALFSSIAGPNSWDAYEILKLLGGPAGSLDDALPELDANHQRLRALTYEKASNDAFSFARYAANENKS